MMVAESFTKTLVFWRSIRPIAIILTIKVPPTRAAQREVNIHEDHDRLASQVHEARGACDHCRHRGALYAHVLRRWAPYHGLLGPLGARRQRRPDADRQ